MAKQRTTEPMEDAQSQLSKEISNKAENSTVNENKQAVNQTANIGDESISEEKNILIESEANSSEDSQEPEPVSNILDTKKLNAEALPGKASNDEKVVSCIIRDSSNSTVPATEPDEKVDKFIKNSEYVFLKRAKELLDCDDSKALDLAESTVKKATMLEKQSWLLIALAVYRVWFDAIKLDGGAKKKADKEGKLYELQVFAQKCKQNGNKISISRLYAYKKRVEDLIEKPVKAYVKDTNAGEVEAFKRRDEILTQLFAIPDRFIKYIVKSSDPAQATEKVAEKIKSVGPEKYTDDDCKADLGLTTPDTKADKSEIINKRNLNLAFEKEAKKLKINPNKLKRTFYFIFSLMLPGLQDMGLDE